MRSFTAGTERARDGLADALTVDEFGDPIVDRAARHVEKASQPFLGRAEQLVMTERAAFDPSRTLASIPTLGQNDLCPVGFARPVQRMWKFDICLRHDWSVPP
jgi:hypothetical protein